MRESSGHRRDRLVHILPTGAMRVPDWRRRSVVWSLPGRSQSGSDKPFYKQLAISGVILVASLFFLSRTALTWEQIVIGALALTLPPFGWSALSRFLTQAATIR